VAARYIYPWLGPDPDRVVPVEETPWHQLEQLHGYAWCNRPMDRTAWCVFCRQAVSVRGDATVRLHDCVRGSPLEHPAVIGARLRARRQACMEG